MNRNEIESKVRGFLTEELEIDNDRIFPQSRMKEDMGIDSLELVDVAAFVDECFGFKMNLSDFKSLATYGSFCAFIDERING